MILFLQLTFYLFLLSTLLVYPVSFDILWKLKSIMLYLFVISTSNNQEGFEGQQDPIKIQMDVESINSNTEEKQPQPSKYFSR